MLDAALNSEPAITLILSSGGSGYCSMWRNCRVDCRKVQPYRRSILWPAMKIPYISDVVKRRLRELVEGKFVVWGAALETSLPPEFVVTEHATQKLKTRFKCNSNKILKGTIKAWRSQERLRESFVRRKQRVHEQQGIYKSFNGYIFVFRLRYNKKLGCSQKYLITCFQKKGYQVNT